MANAIRSFEIECGNTSQRLRDKVTSQAFMHENMPRVIDSIIHNEFTDLDSLRSECKALVDSVTFSEKKGIEIDIKPERSVEAFTHAEAEITKTLHKSSKSFVDALKKLESFFQKTPTLSESLPPIKLNFARSTKTSTISITDGKVKRAREEQQVERLITSV